MHGLIQTAHKAATRNGLLRTLGITHSGNNGDLIDSIADQIQPVSSVGKGIVAISLPTSSDFIASAVAAWLAGQAGTAIGTRASEWEISRSLQKTTPSWLIRRREDLRFSNFEDSISSLAESSGLVLVRLHGGAPHQNLSSNDAWLASTSGSTGVPKYAVLTFDNLLHNATETAAMLSLDRQSDRVFAFTPSHFSYALNQALSALIASVSVTFWPHGLLAPADLWAAIQQNQTTILSGNPTSYEILLKAKPLSEIPSMRTVVSGGQPFNATLAKRLVTAMPNCDIISAYGCSEYVNRITYRRYNKSDLLMTTGVLSVGKPIGGTTVELISTPSALTEVILRGDSLMRGYLDEVPHADWQIARFATGDIGEWTCDGDLTLTGRVKTLMNIANEMVSPEEIEAVARAVPDVKDCAVTSIVHDLLGEAICALVVIDESLRPRSETIHDIWLEWRTKLSRIKLPTTLKVVSDNAIPRTDYGKIDRVKLAQVAPELSEPQ